MIRYHKAEDVSLSVRGQYVLLGIRVSPDHVELAALTPAQVGHLIRHLSAHADYADQSPYLWAITTECDA